MQEVEVPKPLPKIMLDTLQDEEDMVAGLSSDEAAARLEEHGRNEIPEKVSDRGGGGGGAEGGEHLRLSDVLHDYWVCHLAVQVIPWYMLLSQQFVGAFPGMIELAMVLAAVVHHWEEFGIILFMLLVNAAIGLHQELKARASVNALKTNIISNYSTKRDGVFQVIQAPLLVPGDVVFLKAGDIIPADCSYLTGDILQVDTSVLTGEPFPRKVPDNDAEEGVDGRALKSGCTIKQGTAYCLVEKTGLDTEIGQAAKLMHQSSARQRGLLETKILTLAKTIIFITLCIVVAIVVVQVVVRKQAWELVVVRSLSLTIASVPVALPLVMQIMMTAGAKRMATKKAIVTHLTALQEIASMDVLCTDKTGTLTTAEITVFHSHIVSFASDITKDQVLLFGALACNPDDRDDPIDTAVLAAFHEHFGTEKSRMLWESFERVAFYPYDSVIKRSVVVLRCRQTGRFIRVAKGLVDRVMRTGEDEAAGGEWEVEDYLKTRHRVADTDALLGKSGYKTLGVAISPSVYVIKDEAAEEQLEQGKHDATSMTQQPSNGNDNNGIRMRFIGILPMLDPPREDTAHTMMKLRELGVSIKMITGDHANIAKETAKLIGLGTFIVPRRHLGAHSEARNQLIERADGFAEVLPMDKQEIVAVLQQRGHVVGMTGDGANDAPALSQAQIGIAVRGSNDAAKAAADILLTQPGLSALYNAVLESRRIYRRLRTFIFYRMAATVQIVLFLSIIIFVYNTMLKAIYVILLAIFNDFTVVLTGYDRATPSSRPQKPTVAFLILVSGSLGVLQTAVSLLFFLYVGPHYLSPRFTDDIDYRQSAVYAQIALAICGLVFVARSDGFFFQSRPATSFMISTLTGMVAITALCGFGVVAYQVAWRDLGIIWLYDAISLALEDVIKVAILVASGEERTLEALHLKASGLIDASELDRATDDVSEHRGQGADVGVKEVEMKEEGGGGGGGGGGGMGIPSLANLPFDVERPLKRGPLQSPVPSHYVASQSRPYPLLSLPSK